MISGTLFAHNAFEYDYCVEASLQSLLHTCDEVVFCGCESTDETLDWITDQARLHEQIKLVHYPWKPNRNGEWLTEIQNFAISQCSGKYIIALQADEVLHENTLWFLDRADFDLSKQLVTPRYNFWKSPQTLCPKDAVCGSSIVRFSPKKYAKFFGDGECMHPVNVEESYIGIYHYGFLRKIESMRNKGIKMEEAYFDRHNPLWDSPTYQSDFRNLYDGKLVDFKLPHPVFVKSWLQERGYKV